ncbi:HAD-IIA family hydrolase [uncultured Ferrimonas sp.]|uniref:HAD-IIA family hydrolase n=1 Tax=uncultured Ferrimonas sp. TaxID=432640 RepID=UPI00260A01A4|nr:HAD-IIA family hydrolase [uncultured Ferrimonas sp.]
MKSVICDIDGVLLHNNQLIPGADKFIARLREQGNKLLCLTNYPVQTDSDLANRLGAAGIELEPHHFYTSAMATADFLKHQEGRRAYVVGEGALTHELYKNGFTITDINPEFVIVGETRSYNWDMIHRAAKFIAQGARFIATNPDTCGPSHSPACGALCAPIERITGKQPFYVGKPSAWIVRSALNHLDSHANDTIIVGDNMSTDILAGFQAGLETVLVLSGVTHQDQLEQFPFRPNHIFANAGEINVV